MAPLLPTSYTAELPCDGPCDDASGGAAKPTAPGRTTPQKVGVRKTVSWSPNLDRSGGR